MQVTFTPFQVKTNKITSTQQLVCPHSGSTNLG